MALRMYNLSEFDRQKAASGSLCAIVAADYQETSIMSSNENLKAIGICTISNNRFVLNYNGIAWCIDFDGVCTNYSNVTVYIIRSSMPIADGSGSKPATGDFTGDEDEEEGGESGSGEGSTTTDSESGSTETGSTDTTNLTSSSKALIDEFAIVMLQAILSKVDRDITGISENEMDYYCDTAYKWAACMMASRTDALS